MRKIKITKNRYALVDDEDYEILSKMKWHCHGKNGYFYASTYIDRKSILMHQFIVNPKNGYSVDHKNGNGLDNTKINLRVCSHGENMRNRKINRNNTSGYKGVWRNKSFLKKYTSEICINGRKMHLGVFESLEEAAMAYDAAAIKYFGEFARTNKSMGVLN